MLNFIIQSISLPIWQRFCWNVKKSGSVDLNELLGDDLKPVIICLVSTPEEEDIIKNGLADFGMHPLEYDLSEMCPEEDMLRMAEICKSLAKELFCLPEL